MTDVLHEPEMAIAASGESKQFGYLAPQQIDMLDGAEIMPMDLMSDYLSPVSPGESWRVIFDCIDTCPVLDQASNSIVQLECAYFWVKDEKGQLKRVRNGSKQLVGGLFNLPQGTPLLLRYLGKAKNKTNSFHHDAWSVQPLRVNVPIKE